MSSWWVVCRKEIRETLRDRRTLTMMIVVPVLLYPVLLIVMEQLLLFGRRNLDAEASRVAVVGERPPELLRLLEIDDAVIVVPLDGDPVEAVRGDAVGAVAVVRAGPGGAQGEGAWSTTLLYDAASDRSQQARGALREVLVAWSDTLLAQRLSQRALPGDFATPVLLADSSLARPEEVGGYALGRILPLLLVVITLLGAFYPAIDLAAGEKERGTLETLLTAPVPARSVVAGKFVAVASIAVVAAALNLVSMIVTFQSGALQVTEVIGLDILLPWSAVGLIFLALVPLAVLFGALFLGLAVRAASFKEAQNALTPVYVVVLVPAMLPIFPGIDFGPLLAVTPVAGVAFLFRDLMTGDADLALGVLVVASTTLYAIAGLRFAAAAFGSERVLFGSDERGAEVETASWRERVRWRRRHRTLPEPAVAGAFVAVLAVLFFLGGVPLQLRFGEGGLLAAQWLLLFLPAVLFVTAGGYAPARTLSLRRPTPRGAAGAVALILGTVPLVWLLSWLQSFVIPIPWELFEGLEALVTADSAARWLWLLLLLAVTPAVCEEIVFRGVLLGSTRRLEPWRFVVLNGVVFGAFHLSFETIVRFLPTATLGMVIAWAVWRTGSLWIGSLMHFLNNGVIVTLASTPALRSALSDPDTPPPLWILPVAAAAATAGARILLAETPAEGPSPGDPTTPTNET